MYVRISRVKKKSGIYEYYQLVESIRVGTTITKRVVCSFGSTSTPTLPASLLELFLSKTSAKLYAFPTAIYQLCVRDLDLMNIFDRVFHATRITSDIFLLTSLMIIHRIIDPDSKLALTRWYKNIMLPVSLPKEIDVSHFYYTLDYLLSKKEEIEKALFDRLNDKELIDTTIVFYDLTSSYFEGDDVEMGAKGYSRDHRPDRPQITLGLVIDRKNGLPLYHEVYEGNMSDSKTVKGILNKLANLFAIKNVIFVADKGMLTPDNLLELKEKGYQSILSESIRNALSKEQREELSLQLQNDTFGKIADNLWYVKTKDKDGKEIILCYNQYTAAKAKDTRDTKIKRLQMFIVETKEKHKEETEQKAIQKVRDTILAKLVVSHARKYFDTKDKKILADLFPIKQGIITREEHTDGFWVVRSNTKDLSTEQLITTYKDLKTIEASFRTIKDVVELRPIYHHKDDRVKGHVFICILAFLVTRLLEQKTGKTIKTIREENAASVAIPGKKQPLILGGRDLLQAIQ